MELTTDWRILSRWFGPERRALSGDKGAAMGPLFYVIHGDRVVSAYAEGESVRDLIGLSPAEVRARFAGRNLVPVTRVQFLKVLKQSVVEKDFLKQLTLFQEAFARDMPKNCSELKVMRVLHPLVGWWAKVLPNNYGVLIRKEDALHEDLLVIVDGGRITHYFEPDLSTLDESRVRDFDAVVKNVSERAMLPIQGMKISSATWDSWIQAPNPWPQILKAIRLRELEWVPFRAGPAFLVLTRALTGV